MKKMVKEIFKTKKGFPALWECGGGFSNTGEATIVANSKGEAKKPVYIRRRGHLANANHALVVVEVEDVVVMADHHRNDFNVSVYRIADIQKKQRLTKKVSQEFRNKSKLLQYIRETREKASSYMGLVLSEYIYCSDERKIYRVIGGELEEQYVEVLLYGTYYGVTEPVGITEVIPAEFEEYYEAELKKINTFSRGEWDTEPPAELEAAIQAAKEKATCYHCRSPHFIIAAG